MKILVFLHGTSIMHKNAEGHNPEEIAKQVIEGEESVTDYSSYIPVGNAVEKLKTWETQGAKILYFSSHKKFEDVEQDKAVLKRQGFPKGLVYYRKNDEEYHTVVERIKPDILVEDDAKSIGGDMISPTLNPKLGIKIIVVKEFAGIDNLPDEISVLSKNHSQAT
ncbi:MAG: hypothetical protein ABIG20_01620 [archaeon]